MVVRCWRHLSYFAWAGAGVSCQLSPWKWCLAKFVANRLHVRCDPFALSCFVLCSWCFHQGPLCFSVPSYSNFPFAPHDRIATPIFLFRNELLISFRLRALTTESLLCTPALSLDALIASVDPSQPPAPMRPPAAALPFFAFPRDSSPLLSSRCPRAPDLSLFFSHWRYPCSAVHGPLFVAPLFLVVCPCGW